MNDPFSYEELYKGDRLSLSTYLPRSQSTRLDDASSYRAMTTQRAGPHEAARGYAGDPKERR